MAYTLVGTVVDVGDVAANFTTRNSGANISGDDDFVQGTGAVGDKMSNTTELLVSNTLSGGASGVYNFSSGGAHDGYHFIGWINTKTPIDATDGLAVYFRNAAGHFGTWNVMPASFYKGGFTTRVISPSRDFDAATTWTVGGNPAQLDDVSEMGFQFHTITTIMGAFNNTQIDQFTVGTGIRADAGTGGSPNTFAGVVNQDEGTSFWGWWSSSNGANVGKGKLYIGPATGSATSVFTDSAFSVTFANEKVASTFYEISMRGAGTDVSWTLANISAASPSTARWRLTVASDTNSFADTNGVWAGGGQLVLSANTTLTGTTIIDTTRTIQNSAVIDFASIISANTTAGVAFLESNVPSSISNSTFTYSDGYAIEITTPGTYDFTKNTFTGYLGTPGTNLTSNSGSDGAAIYNNSFGAVTLNILGGGTSPSVANGPSATTTISTSVPIKVTVLNTANVGIVGVQVSIHSAATDAQIVNDVTNSSGIVTASFSESTPANVYIRARLATGATKYIDFSSVGTISTTGLDISITLQEDPNIGL